MTLVLAVLLASATAAPDAPPAPLPPAPYSLPWLLRPATPSSVVRLDETMAFYETPASGANGSSYLTGLTATYKLNPHVVPVFRAVFVDNHAPEPGKDPSGSGFANPLLGVNYLHALKNGWRWTGFLASTIPVGAGGGALPIRAPPPP